MVANSEKHVIGYQNATDIRAAAIRQVQVCRAFPKQFNVTIVSRKWLAIDKQLPFSNRDQVATNPHHALDQPVAISGRIEDDDFAATYIIASRQFDVCKWNSQTVRRLVDKYPVALHQRVFHRAGWHVVMIGK